MNQPLPVSVSGLRSNQSEFHRSAESVDGPNSCPSRSTTCHRVKSRSPRALTLLTLAGMFLGCGCGPASNEPAEVQQTLLRLGAQSAMRNGWLDAVSFEGTSVTNADLESLRGRQHLRLLELRGTEISDDGLRRLAGLEPLEAVGLAETKISDDGLLLVATFPNLTSLYLQKTAVTDAGLLHLQSMLTLRMVDLSGSQTTAQGVAAFRAALPQCDVVWDETSLSGIESSIARKAPSPPRSSGALPLRQVRVRSPKSATSIPPAADLYQNVSLTWTSAAGSGGAVLPRLRELTPARPDRGEKLISRVVGAVFTPGSEEVVFLGVEEPGWPVMTPEDLIDGLGVALQSQRAGISPGVTFEPADDQIGRPPREDELHKVEYFGTARGTIVGWATYEADRVMKCLGGGRDNITKEPFLTEVPGFVSELSRVLDSPRSGSTTHRFWIKTESSRVTRSNDGLTLLAEVDLKIDTRDQKVQNGEYVDAAGPADPAARAFADHLTEHYSEFAREFPAFAYVHNFAVLSAVAEAIATNQVGSEDQVRLLTESLNQFADHQPRPVHTPDSTPVTVVTAKRTTGNRTDVARIAGGVTLRPANQYTLGGTSLGKLASSVRSGRPAEIQRVNWTTRQGNDTYGTVALRSRKRRRVWHEDLQAGRLSVVRELVRSELRGTESDHWIIRTGQIRTGPLVEKPEPNQPPWQNVSVQDADGNWHVLRPCTISSSHTEGPVPGYTNQSESRSIELYSNVWIQVDQPVEYRSVNGGPYLPTPSGLGRIVEYSPESPHRAQRIVTAQGVTDYSWKGDRLDRMTSGADTVSFTYDADGRLKSVSTSDDRMVSYRYDKDSQLREVSHGDSEFLVYEYDADRRLVDVTLPPDTQFTTTEGRTMQVRFRPRPPEEEQRAVERQAADAGMTVVSVERFGDPDTFRIVLNGREAIFDGNLNALREEAPREVIDAIRKELEKENSSGETVITVTGSMTERQLLGMSLHENFPDNVVTVTSNIERSQQNLADGHVSAGDSRIVIGNSNMLNRAREQLETLPSSSDSAPVVIFSGHNDVYGVKLGEVGQQLISMIENGEVREKFVFLNTCGNKDIAFLRNELIASGGAKGVIAFQQPISQSMLGPLTVEFQQCLSERSGPLDHATIQQIMQESVNALERKVQSGDVPQELLKELPAGEESPIAGDAESGQIPQIEKLRSWFFQTRCEPGIEQYQLVAPRREFVPENSLRTLFSGRCTLVV